MALSISSTIPKPQPFLNSKTIILPFCKPKPKPKAKPLTITCSTPNFGPPRHIRYPPLDRAASRFNRLRFVKKLTTLLLSKPRHFLPFKILSRHCRRYLGLPRSRPLLPFLLRYPTIFHLFHSASRSPSSPSCFHLSVTLTPAAASLAAHLSTLRSSVMAPLSSKLQKLLMMSPHRRILLSKIVHLAPDLGLPVDFQSSICQRNPEKFKLVNTSYGTALELTSWDDSLAVPLPVVRLGTDRTSDEGVMDRPRKFAHLPLRRGLNLRRGHRDYLLSLNALPEVSPYCEDGGGGVGYLDLDLEMAEKRACVVVREMLGMTVEKRTLVDHLTHFRKDFGLPNRLLALLIRHPDMFYVSMKGVRHSVFLVEAFNDDGRLVVEDELLAGRNRLEELVREGKRIRRARRRGVLIEEMDKEEEEEEDEVEESYDLEDLFEPAIGEDWDEIADEGSDDGDRECEKVEELWVKKAIAEGLIPSEHGGGELEIW